MLGTCRDHLQHWDLSLPPYPMPIAQVLAARCAHISIRTNLIDDSDVISDSVLITCPPKGYLSVCTCRVVTRQPTTPSTKHSGGRGRGTGHRLLRRSTRAPTDPLSFWEACGHNNDGLPFTNRAERLPGVVSRREEDLGISASAFAVLVPQSALSRVPSRIQSQSSRGTRVLVQVHYPTAHNKLHTLLSGDRIDPPALTTGLPRTERRLRPEIFAPATCQPRVASSFRARAAYPAPIDKAPPRQVTPGSTADRIASGDLYITFPTLYDLVPISLWECLHNTSRHTIHLNPGLDMPLPPAYSCWRFQPVELLLQAR